MNSNAVIFCVLRKMTAFLLGFFNTQSGELSIHGYPCRCPATDDIGRDEAVPVDECDDGSGEAVRRYVMSDTGKIEEGRKERAIGRWNKSYLI